MKEKRSKLSRFLMVINVLCVLTNLVLTIMKVRDAVLGARSLMKKVDAIQELEGMGDEFEPYLSGEELEMWKTIFNGMFKSDNEF